MTTWSVDKIKENFPVSLLATRAKSIRPAINIQTILFLLEEVGKLIANPPPH